MKVCYLLSTSSVAGGANRSLLDLINQLKRINEDYSCFVVVNGHGTMELALKELGITCYVQTYANAVKSRKALRTQGKRIYNMHAKKTIKNILQTEKPDIIHNNSLPTTIGMELALDLGIPYVCHIRENVWDGLGMEFYSAKTVQKVMNKASCVIAISKYIMDSYKGFYSNPKTVVINDGIVTDDYYSPGRNILSGDPVNVLIVGVVNPQKGQRDAVLAVELLSKKGYVINLTILGAVGRWNESTEYADDLKEYVETKGLANIRFVEPIDSIDELRSFRSGFDINLVCSSAEGLGRTTIESMLSGALTVAADAGASPEIIDNGNNGLLYESGNVDMLADSIEWALLNKDKARDIARSGQNYAYEKYSIVSYAKEIMEIYESIV